MNTFVCQCGLRLCTGPEHCLSNPRVKVKYVAFRLGGRTHDEALYEASAGFPYNPRRLSPPLLGGGDLVPGMRYSGAQFDDKTVRNFHLKKAKAAGVNITGKYFAGHLCRPGYPGDPRAWVSGKDEERAKARAMGYTVRNAGAETEYGIPQDVITNAALTKPKPKGPRRAARKKRR